MGDNRHTALTYEYLDALAARLFRLLNETEERCGDNPAGTYPSDVEMTLRLAFTTAHRAASYMKDSADSVDVQMESARRDPRGLADDGRIR